MVNSVVHASMHIKHSKSCDMQWHWLHKMTMRKALGNFWVKGSWNEADYFNKHYLLSHHRIKCKCYILKGFNVTHMMSPLTTKTFWMRVWLATM
eukprot:11649757-Ditylum_brightwellii.AAC.2